MKGTATEKIEGGKLITVKIDYDNTINTIQILGDFFIHPEESIEMIEKSFLNKSIEEPRETTKDRVNRIVEENDIQLIGVTPEAIVDIVRRAVGK
ncbi:MAG: hypothetical protein ABIJ92_01565 [Candidatus Aenigmatarchaeota archaeon]